MFPATFDLTRAVLDHYGESDKQRCLDQAFADDVPPGEQIMRVFMRLSGGVRRLALISGEAAP